MDQKYKPIQKKADHLQHRMRDVVDNNSDEKASQLLKLSRAVLEDVESNRAPRAVESRIIQLKQVLEHCSSQPTAAISSNHAEAMFDEYEDLRRELRSLPNY